MYNNYYIKSEMFSFVSLFSSEIASVVYLLLIIIIII